MHNVYMRTSITLDDEAYQLVSLYARGRGITLSAAINEAVRKIGSAPSSESSSPRLKTAPNGLRVFASRGRVLTSEMVKAAQEDEID
jgi:predicted transcriptional regulator